MGVSAHRRNPEHSEGPPGRICSSMRWWTRKESNPLDNVILTTYNAADGTERSLFDVMQWEQHGNWHGSTATLKPGSMSDLA